MSNPHTAENPAAVPIFAPLRSNLAISRTWNGCTSEQPCSHNRHKWHRTCELRVTGGFRTRSSPTSRCCVS